MMKNNTKPYAISRRGLLGAYLVIPVILSLVILDQLLFEQKLKGVFDISMLTTMLYLLFFEQPHIVASFIGYADREYIRFYRRKIFIYLPILLIATFTLIQTNAMFAFLAYVVYTMYHTIKQQTGITGMLLQTQKKNMFHMIWTYTLIFYAVLANIYVIAPSKYAHNFSALSFVAILVICIALAYITWLRKWTLGWWHAVATTALVPASYFCIVLGYSFFAVLMIRFVHDITAFIFYSAHDSNRNSTEKHNIIYRSLPLKYLPILLVTPILGIVVTFLLRNVMGVAHNHSLEFLILIGFTHYYIESFMWKHDSIHRTQLRFVS